MLKNSLFRKCISFVLTIALFTSVVAPASAAVADMFSKSSYNAYYVALGDAVTEGYGLDDPDDVYYVRVAEALGKSDDYYAYSHNKLRVEEIRYLLDDGYNGDGYTSAIGSMLKHKRTEVQGYVSNAEVITINAGVRNFSTYIVEQMVHYLENDGAVKYNYSFDAFYDEKVQDALNNIKNVVTEQFAAIAPDEGVKALEFTNFVVEVSTYAVMSYITSFNGMIASTYKLNPDVDLYVIGIYNPMQDEVLSFSNGETTKDIPLGTFFGALVELANAYAQILAPRAYDYTYVDPGNPELLIDQMGNNKLTDEERFPNGLMAELLDLAGDAALEEVIDIFTEYEIDPSPLTMEAYAERFLDELAYITDEEERIDYIRGEIEVQANKKVREAFKDELKKYLGQFANGDKVITDTQVDDLLTDLGAAAATPCTDGKCEACRECIAKDFVETLINNPELQTQAAAKLIYNKLGDYGLKECVTLAEVEQMLKDMNACGENEAARKAVVVAFVHDLAVAKVTLYVQEIVGEKNYTEAKADAMLTAMETAANKEAAAAIAKDALWKDAFRQYMIDKIKAKFDDLGLEWVNTSAEKFVDDIYAAGDDYEAVVRATILASGAAEVSDVSFGIYSTNEVITLFSAMDAKATEAEKKSYLEANLRAKFYSLYSVELFNKFWNAYTSYVDAANTSIKLVGQYLDGVEQAADALAEYKDIQNTVVVDILRMYKENYKDGSLDLGSLLEGDDGLKELQDLRKAAVEAILDGYNAYEDAMDTAMKGAEQINNELTPVYNMLKQIAEVEKISLNDLLALGEKVVGDESYVVDMANRLVLDKTLNPEETTAAYIALRYFIGNGMMIMPSANGHQTIANQIIKGINGEPTGSTAGILANKVIDGAVDIYHCAKKFLKQPTSASGQVGTLINPDTYIAFGDHVTLGTALDKGEKTYVDLLADALAMEYKDTANFDNDTVLNLSFGGMRAEELHALVASNYNGDAYTGVRYSNEYIEGLRAKYQQHIKNADLITVNVGINNLVTYPLMQSYLAYNGQETYEMDWAYYFGQHRVDKVAKGKTAINKLLMHAVDVADNHIPDVDGFSAYEKCETLLTTVATACESLAYGLLGYIVNLDAAVEAIASANSDATIVLVGFYNPMEDTYIHVENVTLNGHVVDLSKHTPINTSALTEKVINIANRVLTNYVGFYADDLVASGEGSRIVTVPILDTELCISDTNAVKDLSTLADWTTVSGLGHEVTIKIPQYFLETRKTLGAALHPNANGHEYIFNQILKSLKYEIHADVVPEDNAKCYGDADPELSFDWDDASSLFEGGTVVSASREHGENVGVYKIIVTVEKNGGYHEIELKEAVFTIKARPITVNVTVLDGVITDAEATGLASCDEGKDLVTLLNLSVVDGKVTYSNDNYDVEINATFEETVWLNVTVTGPESGVYGEDHAAKLQNPTFIVTDENGNDVNIPGLKVTITGAPAQNAAVGNYDLIVTVDESTIPDGYAIRTATKAISYKVNKRPISLKVTVLDGVQITNKIITSGSMANGENLDALNIALVNGVVTYSNSNYEVTINVIAETTPREVYIKIMPNEGTVYYGAVVRPYAIVVDNLTGEVVNVELNVVLDTQVLDTSSVGEKIVKVVRYTPVAGYNVVLPHADGAFRVEPRPVSVDVLVLDGNINTITLTDGSLAPDDTYEDLDLVVDGNTVVSNNPNYAVTVNATFETTEVIQVGNVVMGDQSLILADEVHYRFEFELQNFKLDQVVEIGLLRFYTKFGSAYDTRDTDLVNTIFSQADEKYTWTLQDVEVNGNKYVARTEGIPAKNLGDDTWFRAYVKLKDGTYCYSLRYVYDAVRYSKKAVEKYPEDTGLHALCAAMLNYGTAAQMAFDYKTDDLMNTVLDNELSNIKSLVADYDASMLAERLPARTSPYGEFDNKSGKISTGQYNLTLLGAISLNAYGWNYSAEGVTEAGFFVWNHDTFAKGETLTQANADYQIKSDAIDGSIEGSITGIAAADMCDTFAVAPYILIDGTYYYCGISRISVDYYAEKIINDTAGRYTELDKNLARFMVVYGDYAEKYFR